MRNTTERAAGTAALVALAAVGLAAPGSAAAAGSSTTKVSAGLTTVTPSGAAYRTLQRSKVKVSTLGDATKAKSRFRIPVTGGTAGTTSDLRHASTDGLALRRGSRTVRVTGLRIRLAKKGSRVTGRIDGKRAQTLFTLPATTLRIDGTGRTARSATRSWRLTASGARALGRELGVERLRAGAFARAASQVVLAGSGSSTPTPGGTPAPGTPTTPTTPSPGDAVMSPWALNWGLRQSFRNYLGSDGRTTPSDGATINPDGTFRFNLVSVTGYDGSGALSASFRGTVYFEKWGVGEAAMLRLWLRNPRIEAATGATVGSLYVDMSSKQLSTGQIVDYPGVRLATIDLAGGTRAQTDGQVRWNGVPTKLTAEGVPAFADFYAANEPLDPLNLTVAVP